MGIPVATVGSQHICPMKDGKKPHQGGKVIEGVSGVFIDGKPVATVGSKCQCCSPNMNTIVSGSMGILIDGKPIALVGSQTEHGGIIIDGIPGVTISGGFPTKSDQPGDFEPQVFNLQWTNKETIIHDTGYEQLVVLTANTVGYEDGEEVTIKIYADDSDDPIDQVTGIVQDGRIEVEWSVERDKLGE